MVKKDNLFFNKIKKYSILTNNIVNVHFKDRKIDKEIKIFIPVDKISYNELIEFWSKDNNKKHLEKYFKSYLSDDISGGKLHKRIGHKDSYEISYTYMKKEK